MKEILASRETPTQRIKLVETSMVGTVIIPPEPVKSTKNKTRQGAPEE